MQSLISRGVSHVMTALVIVFSRPCRASKVQTWKSVELSLSMYLILKIRRLITQTITSKYFNGAWTKGNYYQNGTSRMECSDDGVNWSKDTCK